MNKIQVVILFNDGNWESLHALSVHSDHKNQMIVIEQDDNTLNVSLTDTYHITIYQEGKEIFRRTYNGSSTIDSIANQVFRHQYCDDVIQRVKDNMANGQSFYYAAQSALRDTDTIR